MKNNFFKIILSFLFSLQSAFSADIIKLTSGGTASDFNCEMCHSQANDYLSGKSMHHQKEMECGQCHVLKKSDWNPSKFHPDVNKTRVSDLSCAGCHNEQYQQILESEIYAKGVNVEDLNLISNRRNYRGDDTRARYLVGDKFIKGQMCVSCHYNDHKFGRPDASKVVVGSMIVREYMLENRQMRKIISHKIKRSNVILK